MKCTELHDNGRSHGDIALEFVMCANYGEEFVVETHSQHGKVTVEMWSPPVEKKKVAKDDRLYCKIVTKLDRRVCFQITC